MTPGQCRQARELLGWPEWKLAYRAGHTLKLIQEFEAGLRSPRQKTLSAIRAALEDAGVDPTAASAAAPKGWAWSLPEHGEVGREASA